MRDPNWKKIAILLFIVAVISTVCAGYWYHRTTDRLCPACQGWHPY